MGRNYSIVVTWDKIKVFPLFDQLAAVVYYENLGQVLADLHMSSRENTVIPIAWTTFEPGLYPMPARGRSSSFS